MELIVEILRAGRDPADLVLEVEPTATFGDLADSLEFLHANTSRTTLAVERTGQTPRRDDRVADVDVRSGDRLHLVDAVNAAFSVTPHAVGATLVVTSAGGTVTEYPLRYGENTVGRDLDNDVVIKDQEASRHHARIGVTDNVTITDLGSKNGVSIGGRRINGTASLRAGHTATIGELTLAVTDHLKAVEAVATHNRVEFNRPPRIARPYSGAEFEFPAPPNRPRKQRLPMITAFLPVVFGLTLLLVFPSFGVIGVAFMMLSPILILGSYIEAKRSGKYDFKDQLAEHQELVGELVEQLEDERIVEVNSRFHESPAATELPAFARSLSPRLWERAPEDADFLTVRLGTAALPSRNQVTVAQGGARDLRKELEELPSRFRTLDDVPLAVPLLRVGGVGLSGPLSATRALARSIVLQAATLHSPADLAVVALVGDDGIDHWTFLKWLPHARTLGGAQLASTSHHALGLVETLLSGRAVTGPGGERKAVAGLPSVLVVIDESCPVERRRLMPLLESGRHLGIAFVWVASASHRLPKDCGAVVDISADRTLARTGFTDSGLTIEPTRWEGMALADAEEAARLLTPVIDVTGRINDDSEIPSSVGFADLYGGEHILDDATSILELWRQQEGAGGEGGGLRVVAGMQSGAPFVLDIRQDGPHALVAGTTGAGKSEFLQSLIVGLATMHSPERVTFLLVDYKGGAAFKECVELPHTVGMVTDLDRNEVRRALTSLNAELHHRELLLQKADAKDLLEMERKGHPDTPPSLLIVVDEFAALAKEVPEFVDGVVDVALRGRSLGLHLVLATQRPAGVITGQIRANTNLRIALRMAADDESADVVGSPVAAGIDRRLPGRAVARIGPQELLAFQSAYVGGHTLPNVQPPMVRPRIFGFDHDTEVKIERRVVVPPDHTSDLQRLIVAHRSAFDLLGVPAPRKPWLPSLSTTYSLGRLPASPSDSAILIGVEDQPERQIQTLTYWRPDSDGGMILLGTGGSGKTVALRTVAISAGIAAETSGEPVEVYGLDFAGRGLDLLESLPHVGSVVSGDDTERVTRMLRMLRERIDARAQAFAAVRASSLPEFRRNAPQAADSARIIVLLDSYPGFQAVHERIEAGRWLDLFGRLVADGRGVGIHFVLTADRRNSVPTAIVSSIPRVMTLRLANDDEYLSASEPAGILSPHSPPGRGITNGREIQLAVLGGSANGERQAVEIGTLADRLTANGVRHCPPVGILPLEVRRSTLTLPSTEHRLIVAVGDNDLGPRGLVLEHGHILVAGPARSGRTTALATIAQSAAEVGVPLFHLHIRPTPLANAPFWAKVARGADEGAVLLRKLQDVAPRFGRRVAVIVDDLHELCDGEADDALVDLLRAVRELPVTIVAAIENQAGRRQYSGAIPELRKDGNGFLLQPDIDVDGDILGVALPRGLKGPWPEGRGFLAVRGRAELAHVALPDPW